jgi:arginase
MVDIISAPSILGLKPNGVQRLGRSLLKAGLADQLKNNRMIIHLPTLNHLYSNKRDADTNCLNTKALTDFSAILNKQISYTISKGDFALVLGGDCSILLGIMPALKAKGTYALIFLDAHADFYQPERSTTGEAADMDLALITGRGPEILTNMNNMRPYVADEHVVHIGQRDWEETQHYGSQDIKQTAIKCFDLAEIEQLGIDTITSDVLQHVNTLPVDGFWIHFDTDVLADEVNPAVDYRIPGGLQFEQAEHLISCLLQTGKIMGMSVTIFNPELDEDGQIAKEIVGCLGRMFE